MGDRPELLGDARYVYAFWHEYLFVPSYVYARPDTAVLIGLHRTASCSRHMNEQLRVPSHPRVQHPGRHRWPVADAPRRRRAGTSASLRTGPKGRGASASSGPSIWLRGRACRSSRSGSGTAGAGGPTTGTGSPCRCRFPASGASPPTRSSCRRTQDDELGAVPAGSGKRDEPRHGRRRALGRDGRVRPLGYKPPPDADVRPGAAQGVAVGPVGRVADSYELRVHAVPHARSSSPTAHAPGLGGLTWADPAGRGRASRGARRGSTSRSRTGRTATTGTPPSTTAASG